MPAFATRLVELERDVDQRLSDFGLTRGQILAVAEVAKAWADDASPLMPTNAPGTLAYIYGVQELRHQFLDGLWEVDRTQNIESVINRKAGVRVGYQNVDRAADRLFPPLPRSAKGSAAEGLSGPNLFEYSGIEAGPLTGVLSDGTPTYYVMVGEDGSVELSHPVIKDGMYKDFIERIIVKPVDRDWAEEIDADSDPVVDFDIPVVFKAG